MNWGDVYKRQTHDAIKQNLQQLGSAASESVNKERTKVKGFAAYKAVSYTHLAFRQKV